LFYLNKDVELDAKLLRKMINRFHVNEYPRLSKYKNYYDGFQRILHKAYADPTKPCNKTVINYCKNITDSYAGYLATPGYISYKSDEDIEEIMAILRYNDYQFADNMFLLNALIYGVSAELMFIDEQSKTRFRSIDPTTCFGVYDDSLTGDLLYFVRFYKVNEWDETDLYHIDVYSDTQVTHYIMRGI
jgi:SPP1 family phage portal protein